MIKEIGDWLDDGAPVPFVSWYCAYKTDEMRSYSRKEDEELLRDTNHELGSVFS